MTRTVAFLALGTTTVVAALAGCGGCGGASTEEAPPQTVPRPMPAASVAAGTDVNVTMTDRLSTRDSKPGDYFVAHVDDPLVAVDGRVLVNRGAVLRGHVVRVDHAPTSRIDVAFDTIETRDGPVRIHAILVDVGGHGEVLTMRMGDPSDGGITPSRKALGGGPAPADARDAAVTLPEGSRIRLMLLDPVVPLDRR